FPACSLESVPTIRSPSAASRWFWRPQLYWLATSQPAAPPRSTRSSHCATNRSWSFQDHKRTMKIISRRRYLGATPSGRRPIYSGAIRARINRSEEHTSELQSRSDLVCRLLLEKKKKKKKKIQINIE